MYCTNCANATDFYLTFDCAIPLDPTGPGPPDLALDLQCRDCGSLAVHGDPVAVLQRYL